MLPSPCQQRHMSPRRIMLSCRPALCYGVNDADVSRTPEPRTPTDLHWPPYPYCVSFPHPHVYLIPDSEYQKLRVDNTGRLASGPVYKMAPLVVNVPSVARADPTLLARRHPPLPPPPVNLHMASLHMPSSLRSVQCVKSGRRNVCGSFAASAER